MDQIDLIMYINLSHRTDRNQHIVNELTSIGFNTTKIKRLDAVQHTLGGIGCGLSHIQCLEYAIENKCNNILIVEDDFKFIIDSTELNSRLTELFSTDPNYDVYLLGRNLYYYTHNTSKLYRVVESQAASCYLVSSKFMKTLLANYKEAVEKLEKHKNEYGEQYKVYAIDQYSKQLQKTHVYLTHKFPCGVQQPSYSDIENVYVDYRC